MSELEIIQYGHIDGMSVFLNSVEYRTPHFHQDWELLLGFDNNMKISSESENFMVGGGDLVLFPPGTVHEFQAENNPATFLCLQVSPKFINVETNLVSSSFHPADYLAEGDLKVVKKLFFDLLECYITKPFLYKTLCNGYCNVLMYKVLKKIPSRCKSPEEMNLQNRKNERLNRLIDFVNENYMRKITLSEFAEKEGLTMNYVSHFVKDSLNRSFQSYVNTVRFHAACKLIDSKSCKMKEVYKKVGFSDYKYFSNAFKTNFSMTPEEYSKKTSCSSEIRPIFNQNIDSSERRLSDEESLVLLAKERKEYDA